METYTELKELSENPNYHRQREETLRNLTDSMIDQPIIDLIKRINRLPYCFTLQSCYGHFVYNGQENFHNLEPLATNAAITEVKYRIAYIAFCIEMSLLGKKMFDSLKSITAIDFEYIQFGCAEWFWERQINSYVLQVEPDRFKYQDTAIIAFNEALHVEKIRREFFSRLDALLEDTP